jgi:hypothetical protein
MALTWHPECEGVEDAIVDALMEAEGMYTLNVTAGTGGTLELHLVPFVLVRQSQELLLCARAGL